jgi:hypothetical protein
MLRICLAQHGVLAHWLFGVNHKAAKAWAFILRAHLGWKLGPTCASRPSWSDYHARSSERTKPEWPAWRPEPLPSFHFRFTSHSEWPDETSAWQRAKRRRHPRGCSLAHDVHRRVSTSPSSRLAVVPLGWNRSQTIGDPTSGGGCAVALGPSRSLSKSNMAVGGVAATQRRDHSRTLRWVRANRVPAAMALSLLRGGRGADPTTTAR